MPPARPRVTGRAAILVLVVAVLMISYGSSLRAFLEQRSHLSDMRASITESGRNIASLEREKARWDDPAYVEAQARRRFGWVMPGEIAFQVIDENGQPLTDDASLTDPDAAPEADEPEWWQSVWGSVKAAGEPDNAPRGPADRLQPPQARLR